MSKPKILKAINPATLKLEKLYPRKCSACGDGMFDGYCVGDGEEYYCSDKCLHTKYSAEQWKKMYEGEVGDDEDEDEDNESSDNYYTVWEQDDIDLDEELIFKHNKI